MADFDPEVNIDALHDAIEAKIKVAFPDFQTVEFYRDDEDQLVPTPACLLAMTDAEPTEDDAGTGQWPVLLRFEAHIIMPHRSKDTRINIRRAALAMATWLHQSGRFGGEKAQVIACEPDEFAPVADKFMAWRVEFVIKAFLGETAWTNDGTIPADVLFSWSPKIGTGNEGEYTPVLEPAP